MIPVRKVLSTQFYFGYTKHIKVFLSILHWQMLSDNCSNLQATDLRNSTGIFLHWLRRPSTVYFHDSRELQTQSLQRVLKELSTNKHNTDNITHYLPINQHSIKIINEHRVCTESVLYFELSHCLLLLLGSTVLWDLCEPLASYTTDVHFLYYLPFP
jgi:hypothetical protein